MRDWTGNRNSCNAGLGVKPNHTTDTREARDFYATDPIAIDYLVAKERLSRRVLEPCAGAGHLSRRLAELGYDVTASDIEPQADGILRRDFLLDLSDGFRWDGDIVTNPPYVVAKEIIEQALSVVSDGAKVCMFMPIRYLASNSRLSLFRTAPPRRVWVFSWRVQCAKNGDFAVLKGSTVDYAWFVWEKGWRGETTLGWIGKGEC